jgi:hypothetical protein
MPSGVQQAFGEDAAPLDSARISLAAGCFDELESSTRAPERERERDTEPYADPVSAVCCKAGARDPTSDRQQPANSGHGRHRP